MALQDPVAIYYAKTNTEAMLLCHILKQDGIEAFLMEDNSMTGVWIADMLGNIRLPKVWVDKSDEARAAALIQKYEQNRFDHDPERAQGVGDETLVQAACEECGHSSMFSGRILGSVQECPVCGKFMDVESADDRTEGEEGWGEDDAVSEDLDDGEER